MPIKQLFVPFKLFFALAIVGTAVGQDQELIDPPSNSPAPTLVDRFNDTIDWAVNRTDLEIRRALALFSDHELRYFVGRYWINQFDSVLDRANREVGIWGIEAPEGGGLRFDDSPVIRR